MSSIFLALSRPTARLRWQATTSPSAYKHGHGRHHYHRDGEGRVAHIATPSPFIQGGAASRNRGRRTAPLYPPHPILFWLTWPGKVARSQYPGIPCLSACYEPLRDSWRTVSQRLSTTPPCCPPPALAFPSVQRDCNFLDPTRFSQFPAGSTAGTAIRRWHMSGRMRVSTAAIGANPFAGALRLAPYDVIDALAAVAKANWP